MRVFVINGPNLNMLGIREPDIYGKETYETMIEKIRVYAENLGVEINFFQSNHEGVLVDIIQSAHKNADAIIINPAAYTHTSVALLDALKAVGLPSVEVHLSKVEEREDFRQISFVRHYCEKTITGQGVNGYLMAIDYLVKK